MNAHEIDYRIIGSEMQCVEVHLDQGESVVAEAGYRLFWRGRLHHAED